VHGEDRPHLIFSIVGSTHRSLSLLGPTMNEKKRLILHLKKSYINQKKNKKHLLDVTYPSQVSALPEVSEKHVFVLKYQYLELENIICVN
jgi:hypothetical protein